MALRDIVTKDVGWKLFSLILAVAIWLTVKSISTEAPAEVADSLGAWELRTLTNMPVLVVSEAADVRECKVSPDRVDVEVRVRPEVLTEVLEKQVHVTVDLTDIESSRGLSKRVDVATPAGVTLVDVTPEDVYVIIPPKRNNQ